ncbi:DUF5403 family protein [Glutamicibacter creatinolyticus]|uniref:DUF5403 family protein n=1 Tax=Glutamicibacter creatinolyticus TaxID=162496 RepID=UPI003D2EDF18
MLNLRCVPGQSLVCRVAKWLEWYGHGQLGRADVKRGSGSVEDIVSHHRSVHAALDHHQMIIAAKARSNLETRAHRRTGSFQVGTKGSPPTKLDRYIYLSDTGEGNWWSSAASLEFGHWAGKPGSSGRTWVPGKWILHDAAGIPHSH